MVQGAGTEDLNKLNNNTVESGYKTLDQYINLGKNWFNAKLCGISDF